jgi:hypothetical protein
MARATGARRGLCDGCGRFRPNPVDERVAARNPLEPIRRILGRFTPFPLPGAAVSGICPVCLHHRDEPDRW